MNVRVDEQASDAIRASGPVIDLNCDLGEGFGIWRLGEDEALLPLITSANVACGFHAGDPSTMRRVCDLAAEHGVAIGAQVAYRDLAGFGRRFIDVDPAELTNDVLYQIAALDGFARGAGTRVSYVKPHGGLYNALVTHAAQAAAVVEAVRRYDPTLPVLGLPGSQILRQAADAGLTPIVEAFADRAYTDQGALVPRRQPGAVLEDRATVVDRSVRLAKDGVVESVDGNLVAITPRSLCVHGDTPGAVAIAGGIREALLSAGVTIAPFVPVPAPTRR
ncbi:LamB/YcsF family protein [Allostreptomyces psammosilenae]|uniref:5-oxoprolinase subunit A n=1 Tax=Allostreptomyces psammosilenae TaxID=1892865 RepID=A0A853A286_9ACTN|nr:5-oxoprolinase subunit PxpA [Allostreptomyces psammosilenae]NYI08227.1 UPF0271 protein [Allostreptomyces psammosilenae]